MPAVEVAVREIKRPPVIMYGVENNRQTLLMTGIDKGFEIVRTTILIIVHGVLIGRRVWIGVHPIELRHWQQLHRGETHAADFAEIADRRLKRSPA